MGDSDTNYFKCLIFTTSYLLWMQEVVYQSKVGCFFTFSISLAMLILHICLDVHIDKKYYIICALQIISIIVKLFLLKNSIIGSLISDGVITLLLFFYGYKVARYLNPKDISHHKLYVLEEEEYKNED